MKQTAYCKCGLRKHKHVYLMFDRVTIENFYDCDNYCNYDKVESSVSMFDRVMGHTTINVMYHSITIRKILAFYSDD
jgi:hypothetical protein